MSHDATERNARHSSKGAPVSQRIIVVGAGAIGAATALRLAETGAAVTLVEAEGPGAGTTGKSFAWFGASHRYLRDYYDLNLAGVAAHRRLQVELGPRAWYHPVGALRWGAAVEQPALAAEVAELRERAYPAVLLSPARAAELEPAIRPGPGIEQIAWFPDEGYVDGREMAADLVALARARGTRLRRGAAVTAIEESASEVTVGIEGGERLSADTVVLCAGRHTWRLAELAGSALPMVLDEHPGSYVLGLLVATTRMPHALRRITLPGEAMSRPETNGRALLRTDAHDLLLEPDTAPARLRELAGDVLEALRAYIALPAEIAVDEAIVGRRALPADRLPVAGWLPGCARVYAAVTHSGMTIAPALGELIAAEVGGGEPEPMLERYRPGRLAGAA
jgi:glycine/D-amino acid oxidase-like deaminating enzyme